MGILVAFAVGYAFGARAGTEGLDEVVEAMRQLRDSEEVEALVGAVRSYLSHALREMGESLAPDTQQPLTGADLLGRLRGSISSIDPSSRQA